MKKFLIAAALICGFTFSQPAFSYECSEPKAFVKSVTDKVISVMDSSSSESSKKSQLDGIFREVVDSEWMSKFVLGRHARSITPAQQTKYSGIYKNFLTASYVSKFDQYTGEEKINVTSSTPLPSDNFGVNTVISSPSDKDLNVGFRLRKQASCYKVVDINAEGVSLLNTQRQDFTSYINRNGFDSFLTMLEKKSIENSHGTEKTPSIK